MPCTCTHALHDIFKNWETSLDLKLDNFYDRLQEKILNNNTSILNQIRELQTDTKRKTELTQRLLPTNSKHTSKIDYESLAAATSEASANRTQISHINLSTQANLNTKTVNSNTNSHNTNTNSNTNS